MCCVVIKLYKNASALKDLMNVKHSHCDASRFYAMIDPEGLDPLKHYVFVVSKILALVSQIDSDNTLTKLTGSLLNKIV